MEFRCLLKILLYIMQPLEVIDFGSHQPQKHLSVSIRSMFLCYQSTGFRRFFYQTRGFVQDRLKPKY